MSAQTFYDVSVLIPAYNASGTLLAALDSVKAQQNVSVECCVCLNGSANEISAMEALIAQYKGLPIVYATLTDDSGRALGAAKAMNCAAALAHGRYFIELDADDTLAGNCLATMASALDTYPDIGFVYGDVQYHGDMEFLHRAPPFYREIFYYGNHALYPFMYRREAWDKGCSYHSLYYDEQSMRQYDLQDWDMLLQLTEHMRYTGMALPGLKVLDYHYKASGTHETARPHHEHMLRLFKQRWRHVTVSRI